MTPHSTSAFGTVLLACLFAAVAHSASADQGATTIPAAAFFNPPEMSRPLLSPNGDAIAILVRTKSGRRQLAILETADLHTIKVAAGYDNADIARVRWVDDNRLVYSITREGDSAGDQNDGGGLYAVDRDGGNPRALILSNWRSTPMQTGTIIVTHVLTPDHVFSRTLRDGSGDVIVEHWTGTVSGSGARQHTEWSGSSPLRLDTRTGRTSEITSGALPHHVFDWMIDDQGVLLAALAQVDGQSTLMSQDSPGHWTERDHFATYKPGEKAFDLHQVGADGRIYVRRNHKGAAALYRLDLKTGQLEAEPLISTPGFDFHGRLVGDSRNHKVLGIHYQTDADGTAWLDAGMAAIQAKVDALLPGLINEIDVSECACSPRMLVTSYSDRQPAVFFLYDRATDKVQLLGHSRPTIDARQMASTEFERIKARDGQELPVYITRPQGKGPWPTVVLVHGGPHQRGWSWAWNPEPQFLASRGYLVVQPEFRGSKGYGAALFESGLKQWGLASQDDIADATTWAARQGLADPKRTCIVGASYGGYATLMGLVRYGDIYRCGVAASAVTDIDMLYDLWWSDFDEEWKGYGMPEFVGDRVKDAAQFAATSPLKQAARIQRPLLLAHGRLDKRVPVEHAERLHAALLSVHAPVSWVLYPDEAHGWYKPETRIDFYEKIATFLNTNIGSSPLVDAPGAAGRP